MLLRAPCLQPESDAACLQDLITQLFDQVGGGSGGGPVCVTSSGLEVQPARVAATPAAVQLRRSGGRDEVAAAAAAREAAEQAAALNADAGNSSGYGMAQVRAPRGVAGQRRRGPPAGKRR